MRYPSKFSQKIVRTPDALKRIIVPLLRRRTLLVVVVVLLLLLLHVLLLLFRPSGDIAAASVSGRLALA